MKRRINKQVLIKRIRLEEKEYDFIINDEKTANTAVESTKGKTTGMIFVKANLYERFTFAVRRFFKEKNKEIIFSILLIALTLLGQYVYDKWIKP